VSDQRLFNMRIDTSGLADTMAQVQRLRLGLRDRRHLHANLAREAAERTRKHLRDDPTHASANRLGATPTGHRAKAASSIESDSDAEAAIIRIPRWTGLARAFGDIVIVPGSGRTYLTIPGDKRTYGKRVGEFPEGTFAFTIMAGRFPALVFRKGWSLAYWLKRSVKQKKERDLLPSDAAYRGWAKSETKRFIDDLLLPKGGIL
jgi:hypothetical protein